MKTIDQKDSELFNKLGVSSILELALMLPVDYNDLTISNYPKINQINTTQVTIRSISKHPNFLKIVAFAWNMEVGMIIFNPKKFHFSLFFVGATFFVQARVEQSFGKIQLIQPKIVTDIGKIYAVYKTNLQQKTIRVLMNAYLSVKNLVDEGLDEANANIIYNLHNPKIGSNFQNAYNSSLFSIKYLEIFSFLKKLNSKKRHFKASAKLTGNVENFVKSLPFKLTNDQKNAIGDIKDDLSKDIAAKRVIMGDVGSGKTIIILSSVMIAYPKKAILMAPTTILAYQIYEEAKKLLPMQIKSVLVTSKDKNMDLAAFDFIIGTHVLLYRELPKCDLVMIDEQHRFGTTQRDMIHKMVSSSEVHPHFLQFSATPIPRTMTLINSSLVDYSFIKEMPFKKEISSFVIGKSGFKNMLMHIENEINRDRQVIVIYPLVEESEKLAYQSIEEGRAFWEKKYRDVYVTFGKDKQKEQILEEFKNRGKILLATTLVEVGISLPKLSTIIIVGAERLGLATLHQLRGRVSRNGLKGYCYLYTNHTNNQRLNEFIKTNSGFDIAELDLKYRQSGDILSGISQHGSQFRYFDIKEDREILIKAQRDLKI
ncbi:MAG: ATP-dependent DNA helicase RecG [Campylobacteraceae bacterium]|jgi:ATP-dependent DNA helicase RecG|nr:ATP-dependent DNA helicase RecG [Campylobacteraceae bacterium]